MPPALDENGRRKTFLHDWRLVLLVIHVGVTAAMIIVILLQRSEGGGLGMGRTDALFSVRGQANMLSRMTAILASIFLFLSLLMAWSMSRPARATKSIMDRAPVGHAAAARSAAPASPAPAPRYDARQRRTARPLPPARLTDEIRFRFPRRKHLLRRGRYPPMVAPQQAFSML